MRVQVIANCQARPISRLLSQGMADIEASEPIILHLAKPGDSDKHLEQIARADVIFAQLTADQFQPAHLSTAMLRERFGDKVIVWPNIFYSGQQPFLRYFTHAQLGRLMGPFEALHDVRLHESWRQSGTVNPAVLQQNDTEVVRNVRAKSLSVLAQRETKCDVTISDFIAENEGGEPLFFTFNHPSNILLSEMARRLLARIGHADVKLHADSANEHLGRYRVPSIWDAQTVVYQGDNFSMNGSLAHREGGPAKRYDIEELCAAFQRVYDSHEVYRTMEKVRMTPDFTQ